MDDPNNPGTCCFEDSANPGQCLCNTANHIDDPNKSKITTNNLWIHIENQKNFNEQFKIKAYLKVLIFSCVFKSAKSEKSETEGWPYF